MTTYPLTTRSEFIDRGGFAAWDAANPFTSAALDVPPPPAPLRRYSDERKTTSRVFAASPAILSPAQFILKRRTRIIIIGSGYNIDENTRRAQRLGVAHQVLSANNADPSIRVATYSYYGL